MALSVSFARFFYDFVLEGVGVDCGGGDRLIDHVIQLSTTALPTKLSLGSIILLLCCLRGRTFRGGGRTRPGRDLVGGDLRIGRWRWWWVPGGGLCVARELWGWGVSGVFMAFDCMAVRGWIPAPFIKPRVV
jgi:hypothetical protein